MIIMLIIVNCLSVDSAGKPTKVCVVQCIEHMLLWNMFTHFFFLTFTNRKAERILFRVWRSGGMYGDEKHGNWQIKRVRFCHF